jgi:hypothetical protein
MVLTRSKEFTVALPSQVLQSANNSDKTYGFKQKMSRCIAEVDSSANMMAGIGLVSLSSFFIGAWCNPIKDGLIRISTNSFGENNLETWMYAAFIAAGAYQTCKSLMHIRQNVTSEQANIGCMHNIRKHLLSVDAVNALVGTELAIFSTYTLKLWANTSDTFIFDTRT